MKTAILTIALALASAFSALAQTVMRENSTVYFQTNVFLHDDPTNPLHQRLSFEGQEPLWVAASNQVVYYQGGEITNASIHARYLYSTNATLTMTGPLNMNSNEITKVSYVTGDTGKGLFFDDNALDFWNSSAIFNADGTNVWQGRVNDTEASRIAALPVSPMIFNSTSWLQSDGTNLFFVSTVPPGFTNALTTNTP